MILSIKFKFDTRKFEKDLQKSINKIVEEKQKEIMIKQGLGDC